jgi:tryptophan-rich sensory protein
MRRFIEIVWMVVAAVSAVEGYISYTATGFNHTTQIFGIVFLVAVFMYFLRRWQRLRIQKMKDKN